MPSKRLLAMGLLSKYPLKSSVLKKFIHPNRGMNYTDYEKMHITALYFTPGISPIWLGYQFQKLGLYPVTALSRMRKMAYRTENRSRWEHLGQENLLFIGQPEVERYFLRRDITRRVNIPNWVLPIFNDHIKQGWTQVKIAKTYKLNKYTVFKTLKYRSMFVPHRPATHLNGNWGKPKKG